MAKTLFLSLIFCSIIFAQDFSKITLKTEKYPEVLTAEELATFIKRDFPSQENQVKALFSWITKHIAYDLDKIRNPKRKKRYKISYRTEEELIRKRQIRKDSIVNLTLNSKKAVCQGYAEVFQKVCNLLTIENKLVRGYVRQSSTVIGNTPKQTNHVWNAVYINGKWIFIDTTWASGSVINGSWKRNINYYYYDIPKKNLLKTHYPYENLWRSNLTPMDLNTFYNQPIYYSDLFNSKIELISPKTGVFFKNNRKEFLCNLKGISKKDTLYIGFKGHKYTQKPKITKQNEIHTISIKIPENTNGLFIIANKKTILEFSIR